MKNFPSLQLLAAGMTAAQPARIECDLETNEAIVNANVLFPQYPACRTTDDVTVSYTMAGVTGKSAPMGSGGAALMPQIDPALTPDRVQARFKHTSRETTRTYSGCSYIGWPPAGHDALSLAGSHIPAVGSSAGWGDCPAWESSMACGTLVLPNRDSAAWGTSAAWGDSQWLRIAPLTRLIPLRSQPAVWLAGSVP